MDPIAISTLVVTIIGAGAAVVAAYFSWKAPTKEDLARVERNTKETATHVEAVRNHTAETAKQVEAVRTHTAGTEGHLAEQQRRQLLANRALRVSISARASGWTGRPLELVFSLKDPTVKLSQIEMLDRHDLPLGILDCTEAMPLTFSVTVDSNTFGKWINGSDNQGSADRWLLRVRAYLEIEGDQAPKPFAILVQQNLGRSSPTDNNWSNFLNVSGDC